ncbi:metal-dependent hydrolase [Candidatus Woesearchaeota archaeon]|nr:metal-dependent hydrolase [Candidatus Woesearchaeota archaeon]
MYPPTHFLLPFTIGLIFIKLGIFNIYHVFICAILGVLIDIDHYIMHIIKSKDKKLSLRDTWNQSTKYHAFRQRSFIHHNKGILIVSLIVILLFFINMTSAYIIAIAYYSHIILDYIHITKQEKYYKFRIFSLYLRESYSEVDLDIALSILILVLSAGIFI